MAKTKKETKQAHPGQTESWMKEGVVEDLVRLIESSDARVEPLLEALTRRVVRYLSSPEQDHGLGENVRVVGEPGKIPAALAKADAKIGQSLVSKTEDDDDGQPSDPAVQYPNLKYAQPKYSNVESVLKYVEDPAETAPGVKLVIMNFND